MSQFFQVRKLKHRGQSLAPNCMAVNVRALIQNHICFIPGFSGSSVVKNLSAKAGDVGSIPGSGRSPGGRNGTPFQYSYLENSMDRGTWQATVHGDAKRQN